jgi:hypothetical protein
VTHRSPGRGRGGRGGWGRGRVESGLPPVRIVFGNYLENISYFEGNTRLCARNQFIIQRVVVEKGSYKNLQSGE